MPAERFVLSQLSDINHLLVIDLVNWGQRVILFHSKIGSSIERGSCEIDFLEVI
jgi:hypothetical protein